MLNMVNELIHILDSVYTCPRTQATFLSLRFSLVGGYTVFADNPQVIVNTQNRDTTPWVRLLIRVCNWRSPSYLKGTGPILHLQQHQLLQLRVSWIAPVQSCTLIMHPSLNNKYVNKQAFELLSKLAFQAGEQPFHYHMEFVSYLLCVCVCVCV